MSKKDRQHQHIQPLTPQLMNQPEKAPDSEVGAIAAREDVHVQALRSEIDRLKVELDAERSRHATEYNALSERAAKLRTDLLAVQVLVKDPASAVSIETEDGKAALKAVGHVLDQRKALHSDLMVLEQTAAGRAPDIALQTDLGKSAAHALSEVLTMMDKMNEQRLEGPALPLGGWASDTARQLVESVPPHERVLLLGDLLAQLLPHTGETGQNETASDVLKRKLSELTAEEDLCARTRAAAVELEERVRAKSERMVKIQSAMVARRAPDAESAMHMALVVQALGPASPFFPGSTTHGLAAKVVDEWKSLRAFFSEAPLVAVAVRDDGAKGPVRERFSLLVLSWDGKSVKTQVVEGTRPWGDISPYLDSAVRKHLIPDAYR